MLKLIKISVVVFGAVAAVSSFAAMTEQQCQQAASDQMANSTYTGTLNIATTRPWGPSYNHAAVVLHNNPALFLSCSDDSCYDNHYGGNVTVASCDIETDSKTSQQHYELQLRGNGVSAALQVPVDGTPPVQSIKIDASADGATPGYDSSTTFSQRK